MTRKTLVGNPLVFNTSGLPNTIPEYSCTNVSSDEHINVCGKNLFHFLHTYVSSYTNANVVFNFNSDETYTITSSGATADTVSAGLVGKNASGGNQNFPTSPSNFEPGDYNGGTTRLGGLERYHNFHFAFKEDTTVTITPNCSEERFYDTNICMKMYWPNEQRDTMKGTTIPFEGYTFVAEANVEYGLCIYVRAGWVGELTFKPQVEINDHATIYEPYNGINLIIPTSENDGEIAICKDDTLTTLNSNDTNTLSGKYNTTLKDGTIGIDINSPSSGNILYNSVLTGAPSNWKYLFKIEVPKNDWLYISNVPKELVSIISMQVYDGSNTYYASIRPNIIQNNTNNTKTYYIRLYCSQTGETLSISFRPFVSTGKSILKSIPRPSGVTTVYTTGNSEITANYVEETKEEIEKKMINTYKSINILTAEKISHPFSYLKTLGPHITIIDDDTTNLNYVQDYHACFDEAKHDLGWNPNAESPNWELSRIVGNYAVEIDNLFLMDSSFNLIQPPTLIQELVDQLIDYEQEGFGMIYHCWSQHGDTGRFWESGSAIYNETTIRENFYKGLKTIKEIKNTDGLGFTNYKHWVTPYGVNDHFIRALAKESGQESLITCAAQGYVPNAIVNYDSNVTRWNIPRAYWDRKNPGSAGIYHYVDSTIATKGWGLVVTHINSWSQSDGAGYSANREAFIDFIKYTYTHGAKITNYSYSYETFKPLLMLHELF